MRFREPRHPCTFPAILRVDDRACAVVVVNVSPGGARLARAINLAPGVRVTLDLAGVSHGATVQWQRQGLAGLRFDRPLSAATLAMVRQVAGFAPLRLGRSARTGTRALMH